MKKLALLTLLGACGSFEDPNIVLDLRVLAMTAEPPEQVFDFDPQDPPENIEDLALVDVEVCALIAEPDRDRALSWTMNVCAPTDELRCDNPRRPAFEIGRGTIEDPETATTPQVACATLPAEPALLIVLEDAIALDSLAGFGGVDVLVSLDVEDQHAAKRVRYAPRLPAERVANQNPRLDRLQEIVEGRDPAPLRLGRCADMTDPPVVLPGGELTILPAEAEGTREDYVVPTFDGGSRMFTESPWYQWLASAGGWSRATTGGPRDVSGMLPPLDTSWSAPDVDEPTDVSLWVVQRDERLGEAWYETCVRVVP